MNIEINELLGKPYHAYAVGPDNFDCWGLACHVLHHYFGVSALDRHLSVSRDDVNQFRGAVASEIAAGDWLHIQTPVDGAVVLLAKRGIYSHVGVWLNGAVLNCRRGPGVCIDSLGTLRSALRMNHSQFYLHKSLV